MPDHDKGYKLLFSHASVVADVLRGFVKEDWVREIDFESLERVDGTFVSNDLRSRDSDMIWRVKWKGGYLYIYLMLEFQSSVEPFMAVRNMTYLGLLYEDLIRRRELTPSGKLPPVFVLVLYNGIRPWNAALDVADLIEPVPGGLEAYRPRFRYALLDENRVPELELESERNVAAALFRLEKSRGLDEFRRAVGRIAANVQVDEGLRKSVYAWLTQVLMPARFPGLQVPEAQSLEEIHTMLAERVMEWTREWKEEGRQEGRQEGIQQGLQDLLLSQMEARFGPVPAQIRRSVEEIHDPEELKRLGKRLFAASSLDDLGLH
jgi:hypothetical protein